MTADGLLTILRTRPAEWRRRGMTPPAELEAIVAARVGDSYGRVLTDPSYADFFVAA
jgi:hypothetical protein